jgi:hypothetical protein
VLYQSANQKTNQEDVYPYLPGHRVISRIRRSVPVVRGACRRSGPVYIKSLPVCNLLVLPCDTVPLARLGAGEFIKLLSTRVITPASGLRFLVHSGLVLGLRLQNLECHEQDYQCDAKKLHLCLLKSKNSKPLTMKRIPIICLEFIASSPASVESVPLPTASVEP